jgi:hypothetical protein
VATVNRETPLQASTLKLIESIPPIPVDLWPSLLSQVISYVRGEFDVKSSLASSSTSTDPSMEAANALQRVLTVCGPFMRKSLRALDALYTTAAPEEVRATHFEVVLSTLSDITNTTA